MRHDSIPGIVTFASENMHITLDTPISPFKWRQGCLQVRDTYMFPLNPYNIRES